MAEYKGLFFNNGIQGIAKIVGETDFEYKVENLMQIIGQVQEVHDKATGEVLKDENGHPVTKLMVTFEPISQYADMSDKGIKTSVPKASVLAPFPLENGLKNGFRDYVGGLLVPNEDGPKIIAP